jgi:hypothetical protein
MCIRECVVLCCCQRTISVSNPFFLYIHSLFTFNFGYAVVLETVFNVIAVAPMWTDQRFHALRLGGHVLSRHFRYYIPEFSGQIVVQTPVIVR